VYQIERRCKENGTKLISKSTPEPYTKKNGPVPVHLEHNHILINLRLAIVLYNLVYMLFSMDYVHYPISLHAQEQKSFQNTLKPDTFINVRHAYLEDLGDADIALGPHLEEKTGHSVVLVRCLHLQDLLVLQGTTKSTRKKAQEYMQI